MPMPIDASTSSATAPTTTPGPARNGTPKPNTSTASTARATTVPSSAKAAYLPVRRSPLAMGDMRNRSNMPRRRSWSIDSALTVIAVCWTIRARTMIP